jgi:hypothetical protein
MKSPFSDKTTFDIYYEIVPILLASLRKIKPLPPRVGLFSVAIKMGNLGMEKRPLRFSLPEAFFEGNRSCGREDCLSTLRRTGSKIRQRCSLRFHFPETPFGNLFLFH